jgi:hypothetical protein
MNNDKEMYQLICDKLLEKYELECEVREIYAGTYSIYVKNFDIQCRFENMSAPVVYCADYVASCCYKAIPKHYREFIDVYTREG